MPEDDAAEEVERPQVCHEDCNEKICTGNPAELLSALEHLMRPVLTETGDVVYDISSCPQIDPGGVVLLMYAARLLGLADRKAMYTGGDGEATKELELHLAHYFARKRGEDSGQQAKGVYWLRDLKDRESMVDELNAWTKSVQEGTHATDEQVAVWQMQLSEVITNAFQHGPMHTPDNTIPPSIVAGKADGSSVQLAALDYGSTIPRVIGKTAEAHGLHASDAGLIRFACQRGITSKSVPQNQGSGLWSLTETVKQNQGTLLILSRNGLVHVCGEKTIEKNISQMHPQQSIPMLNGTLTVINLKIC
jgi:hypothetical protein